MSNTIAIVAAGAPAALVQSAAAIITKACGAAVKTAPAASLSGVTRCVVVGTDAPRGAVACVAEPPREPSAAYAGVKTVVVRAILPRGAAGAMQVRDVVDVYPASGINCGAEVAQATAGYAKAAQVAVNKAKELKVTRVTVVTKPATKYHHLNQLFRDAATKAVEAAGLSVEFVSTAHAANSLTVFPETMGVVLVNDDPVCERVQYAYAGVVGGAYTTYYTEEGKAVHGGHSYKSVALALAEELKALGMKTEASKIEAAARKDPQNIIGAL